MSKTIPTTDWRPDEGWVLTYYPPFTFPFAVRDDHAIQVYDDAEPFLAVTDEDGNVTGYNPNVRTRKLSEFGGTHPGVYAINIAGEEPGSDESNPVHADAIQVQGRAA